MYRGKVISVLEFGAFVEIQGVRHQSQGLVHVKEIRKAHTASAKEILKRGEACWVKVMRVSSLEGDQKVSLSMRDVDQVHHLPDLRERQHTSACSSLRSQLQNQL